MRPWWQSIILSQKAGFCPCYSRTFLCSNYPLEAYTTTSTIEFVGIHWFKNHVKNHNVMLDVLTRCTKLQKITLIGSDVVIKPGETIDSNISYLNALSHHPSLQKIHIMHYADFEQDNVQEVIKDALAPKEVFFTPILTRKLCIAVLKQASPEGYDLVMSGEPTIDKERRTMEIGCEALCTNQDTKLEPLIVTKCVARVMWLSDQNYVRPAPRDIDTFPDVEDSRPPTPVQRKSEPAANVISVIHPDCGILLFCEYNLE
eukprot:147568-Hanusia_phi.AAC.2